MSQHIPSFDELFVVSDIHMGGEKRGQQDFQIFNKGERLAALIDHAGAQRAAGHVAFVLNGDIIDSLAEEDVQGYVALDESVAIRMMTRIAREDDSFRCVWEAFKRFVRKPRRHLVFVLGNHDIELALPPVEAWIRKEIGGNSAARQARIIFATHGGGFPCRVGDARVFCTHGNEVDDWNWVDYSKLGELANAMNAGRAGKAEQWEPNAGTRLVVDVMNAFKRDLPFVDLLKPETGPVVGTLLTIDENAFSKADLTAAFPVFKGKRQGAKVTSNLLSAEGAVAVGVSQSEVAAVFADEVLGRNLSQSIRHEERSSQSQREDELLHKANLTFAAGKGAQDVARGEDVEGTLGWWGVIAGKLGLIDKQEALRNALNDWLVDDDTFHVGKKDETFQRVVERMGQQVNFVITGHTHLARSLPIGPNSHYFNCGTWIRLIQLTMKSLTAQAFDKTYAALRSSTLAQLDVATIAGATGTQPLVKDQANVVHISAEEETGPDGSTKTRVLGELLKVEDGSSPGSVRLKPEPGADAVKV